ncbi:YrhB domain-containing protein [Streptomyces sp. CLV115]|uniref:YrhB domain-containing protein n=1 Tax=Streptomyces sp. CLV115 TaxID=3138502 RepID=UPI00313CB32D
MVSTDRFAVLHVREPGEGTPWRRGDVPRDAPVVIERDDAVLRIVDEELERSHRAWVAAGVEQFPRSVVVRVVEHELVRKVCVQSEEYARTRDAAAMLVGHGPYLVDRVDGGLHAVGVVSEITGLGRTTAAVVSEGCRSELRWICGLRVRACCRGRLGGPGGACGAPGACT